MTTMAPMHASPFCFYSLFCSLGIVWQQDIYPWPCCARPAGHFSGRGHATRPSCDLTSKVRLSNRLVAYIDIYMLSPFQIVGGLILFILRPICLTYQPPASSTFLSEQISHQQTVSNTFSQNKSAPATGQTNISQI
jgi:hypothetical protein